MKKILLIIAAAGLLASVSIAQFMGMGGGSPYNAVSRKDVQKDLKLTDDQNTKIAAAQQDMRAAMRQAFQDFQANGGGGDIQSAIQTTMKKVGGDYEKAVKAVLTDDQQKRVVQIYMQMNGANSLTDEGVQKMVGLTDDQVAKIKDLQAKQLEATAALGKKVQSQEIDFQTMRDDMDKNNAAMKAALDKIMTDAQHTKFKDAQGPKFEQDPNEQQGFGRRPPGGGN